MDKEKEILLNQLELLAELSKKNNNTNMTIGITGITSAMCEIVRTLFLISKKPCQPGDVADLLTLDDAQKLIKLLQEVDEYLNQSPATNKN